MDALRHYVVVRRTVSVSDATRRVCVEVLGVQECWTDPANLAKQFHSMGAAIDWMNDHPDLHNLRSNQSIHIVKMFPSEITHMQVETSSRLVYAASKRNP